ncbi:hypothetical protein M3I54_22850 [Paraburkholderia sp. CNPSo 3274]|uniref:hypothetical protein n=1 Tax=Paraburkholderia sp. CNPSo 3274 TaxID=2940932 RepID=UPI0020B77B05|nr:hypothetical protein [Paraburkholderia sp. CNPSo 3274]MCP3709787.1 hypothetical protein [Paraburkholderia sp. CNPSo 3274]
MITLANTFILNASYMDWLRNAADNLNGAAQKRLKSQQKTPKNRRGAWAIGMKNWMCGVMSPPFFSQKQPPGSRNSTIPPHTSA